MQRSKEQTYRGPKRCLSSFKPSLSMKWVVPALLDVVCPGNCGRGHSYRGCEFVVVFGAYKQKLAWRQKPALAILDISYTLIGHRRDSVPEMINTCSQSRSNASVLIALPVQRHCSLIHSAIIPSHSLYIKKLPPFTQVFSAQFRIGEPWRNWLIIIPLHQKHASYG